MNISKLELLAEYGFKKDPFRPGYAVIETADAMRLKRVLGMAVDSHSMISVVGDRGVGKTMALEAQLADPDRVIVNINAGDKERILISDIEYEMILELSEEPVKRSKTVRARQLRRVLGEASQGREIILVIEEAHRMHGQTLRSLKTLRELKWMGKSPLFTVVMVGQYSFMHSKRGVDEVRLRADTVQMRGLTAENVQEYINTTVGRAFEDDDDAVAAISRIESGHNFLDLQEILISLMTRAFVNGTKVVTALDVYEMFGGGIKELMKKTGVSLADLTEETGISKTTLSLVTDEKQGVLTDEKFIDTRQAISEVIRQKMEQKSPAPAGKKIEEVSA